MRFSKLPRYFTKGLGLERSPRRVAAAKRSVEKDIERNALTPELVRFQTAEDRMGSYERGLPKWEQGRRNDRARAWVAVRCRLRALPENTRKGVLDYWKKCKYPGDPEYLGGLITSIERGQFDPDAHMQELAELREAGWIWRKTGVSLRQQRAERCEKITRKART